MWLFSKKLDLLALYAPVWLTWALCFILPKEIINQPLPIWIWIIFVLGIDVSHVWSTLFRTYFDQEEFHQHKSLLINAPIVAFLLLLFLSLYAKEIFWVLLAYFALYHFIKQQIGFLKMYIKKSRYQHNKVFSDIGICYFSMLYPVLFWHMSNDINFNWFVPGDFTWLAEQINSLGFQHIFHAYIKLYTPTIYFVILALWLLDELYDTQKNRRQLAIGKILWISSTAINWYLGIVYFNSDVAFTITNVVAHGIPYITLIIIYTKEKKETTLKSKLSSYSSFVHIFLIIASAIAFAFAEEYTWDMLIYREHESVFTTFFDYPFAPIQTQIWQATIISLLSLPQVVHYIIDGYIWKGGKNPYLKAILQKSV
jgi:hypothetical protein